MKTQPLPVPVVHDEYVQHITLCWEDTPCPPGCPGCDIALCGADLTDHPWTADTETPCPLCFTLEDS